MADFSIPIGGREVSFVDTHVASYTEKDWVQHGLDSKMISWMGDKQEQMLKYVYSKACALTGKKPAPNKPDKEAE